MPKRKQPTKRPTYTDAFRATAVAALVSEGYPEREGALTKVAKSLNIPLMTLSRWASGASNPPPNNIVNDKKADMAVLIENEMYAIIEAMPGKRGSASYAQMSIVFGTLFDKLRLLRNLPTEIISAAPELTELAMFFRENGIEFSPAVREWREKLEARKAAKVGEQVQVKHV